MKKRDERQSVMRKVIRERNVRTQRELVDALAEMGFKCTQATVSRDIAEMGLRKSPDGTYVLAEDLNLKKMISSLVNSVERADNLIVVKVAPGAANGVAAALDAADLPEVMGTIAGDDTILVIGRAVQQSQSFEETLRRMMGQ